MSIALPPTPATMDDMVQQYVKMRDALKAADDAHKEKTKAAREYLEKLNGTLLDELNKIKGDSVTTPHGTAYRTMRRTASIADGQVFRDFIVQQKAFDLVDWKANALACDDFIKSNGTPPPGVNFNTQYTVGVRRK